MMNDNAWYTYVAAAMALVLVVGFGVGLGLASSRSSAPTTSTGAPGAVDYLNLTISWNPATGLDEYFPGNFTVPSHALVVITITSYDNGTNVVNAPYNIVRGTTGGSERINDGNAVREVQSLPSTGIAHTFTIGSMGAGMMASGIPVLNAVVPPAASMGHPVSVTFGAYFNSTGAFVWNCMAPCDMGAMMTGGLMAGTITIV